MLRIIVVAIGLLLISTPAFSADVIVAIDISQQEMVVSIDGAREYRWDVSTGKRGYRTPTGTYKPIRMYRRYYSKKFDNAPMPYSIFFRGGYAIHGTNHVRSLGSPASHGCVRLDPANAATLYNLVRQFGAANTTIRIKA